MAAPVFYSVCPYGTGTIETGSGTIAITSGVATLSVAQTGNIGAGVEIEYNSLVCYIAPNRIAFTSGGTTELLSGAKIAGGTSGATGIVRYIEVTSGTWAAGTAAGWIYFESTTGTWNSSEQINRTKPTSSSNIATTNGSLQGNIGNGNTQFVVKTATGGTPSNQSAVDITSIHHEYASLSAFEAGFTDSNHINNTSLVTADVVAHACCYYDHDDQTADTTAVAIYFGTTGADNYLQIYTTVGEAESINSQRHDGIFGSGYKHASSHGYNSFTITSEYVRIDGLEIDLGANTNPFAISHNAIGGDVWISNCLINRTTGNSGITVNASNTETGNIYIYNNIIKGNGTASSAGIYNNRYGSIANHYIYNNTIEGFSIGIDRNYGTFVAKNNIITGCTAAAEGTFATGTDYNATNNSSMGYTVTGGGNTHDRVSQIFSFVDESGDNFHLSPSDTSAKDTGTDLSSDADLALWRDIDGNERGASWDIGADEYVATGATDVAMALALYGSVAQVGQANTGGALTLANYASVADGGQANTSAATSLAGFLGITEAAAVEILASLTVSQFAAISTSGLATAEATLLFENKFTVDVAASSVSDASLTLANILALTQSTGQYVDVATTLAAYHSLSQAAMATAEAALAIAHTQSVVQAAQATAGSGVSLATIIAILQSTGQSVDVSTALDVYSGVTTAAQAVADATLLLQKITSTSLSAEATAAASLSLAYHTSLAQSGGTSVAAALSLAILHGISATAYVDASMATTMAQSFGVTESATTTAGASLSLTQSLGVVLLAEAIAGAGFTLNCIQSITQTATTVIAELETPDGRTVIISFESRIALMPSETRTTIIPAAS